MELRAEGVSKRFFRNSKNTNYFYAVKATDFVLPAGKLTEITGRSGSGKSTFLNILSGLLEPTEGKVLLDGTDLYALADGPRSVLRNRSIGVIPQGQTGLHSLTVLENVKLPYALYGETAADETAMALLEQVGIAELRDAYPNELSGGEMRRLAIARALIRKPGILLADEPTGDLDDANTQTVLRLLRQAADAGTAVLLVTHEREAAAYADCIYHMESGVLTGETV
ncbi:MAG: ABC transporter ATP-binding protein [Oscillospiraceae bacterium]|nr:ABC transporter ATP-binding protein [Oscillospiraceae bacterium]